MPIDYTGIEFNKAKENLVNYVKTFYPQFADRIKDQDDLGVYLDLFAFIADLLSFRIDAVYNELFLDTAQRRESLVRILEMLFAPVPSVYQAKTQLSLIPQAELTEDVIIPPNFAITQGSVRYEIMKQKNDYFSSIIIPAGTRDFRIDAFSGTSKREKFISSGENFQTFLINDNPIVTDSIVVSVLPPGIPETIENIKKNIIRKVDYITQTEKDLVYTIRFDASGKALIMFGSDEFNKAIPANSSIFVYYMVDQGKESNISAGFINTSITLVSILNNRFTFNVQNVTAGKGAKDLPSEDELRLLIPGIIRTNNTLVTTEDYKNEILKNFSIKDVFVVDHHQDIVKYGGRFGVPKNSIFIYVLTENSIEIDPDLRLEISRFLEERKLLALDYFIFDPKFNYFSIEAKIRFSAEKNISDVLSSFNSLTRKFTDPMLGNGFIRSKYISYILKNLELDDISVINPPIDIQLDKNEVLILDNIVVNYEVF